MQVIVLDLPEVITDVTNCQPSRQNACDVSFVSGKGVSAICRPNQGPCNPKTA